MKKREFTTPRITQVVNEKLMAEVCNEQFIYTSRGGATSTGFAKVCYHFRAQEDDTQAIYKIDNSQYATNAVIIDVPLGATFIAGCHDGKKWGAASSIQPGWHDFEGSQGTCHFAGDIFIDGVWINKTNVQQYASSN